MKKIFFYKGMLSISVPNAVAQNAESLEFREIVTSEDAQYYNRHLYKEWAIKIKIEAKNYKTFIGAGSFDSNLGVTNSDGQEVSRLPEWWEKGKTISPDNPASVIMFGASNDIVSLGRDEDYPPVDMTSDRIAHNWVELTQDDEWFHKFREHFGFFIGNRIGFRCQKCGLFKPLVLNEDLPDCPLQRGTKGNKIHWWPQMDIFTGEESFGVDNGKTVHIFQKEEEAHKYIQNC